MAYTREELDWIEAEWAYHLHGRSAFLSREDFARLMAWNGRGVPADAIVSAMEAYFERRARRPRPRAFVALSHLDKDLDKVLKLREALQRAEVEAPDTGGWEAVQEPLRSDPRARSAFEAWRRLQAAAPSPDSPGFLDHFDAERKALAELVGLAEAALGPRAEAISADLRERLAASKLQEDTFVWKRAWDHHWSRLVCEAWGIPG
jgi:hypothetical protein